jgi:hypothetical protein
LLKPIRKKSLLAKMAADSQPDLEIPLSEADIKCKEKIY